MEIDLSQLRIGASRFVICQSDVAVFFSQQLPNRGHGMAWGKKLRCAVYHNIQEFTARVLVAAMSQKSF